MKTSIKFAFISTLLTAGTHAMQGNVYLENGLEYQLDVPCPDNDNKLAQTQILNLRATYHMDNQADGVGILLVPRDSEPKALRCVLVREKYVKQSDTLKNCIAEVGTEVAIPLSQVAHDTLRNIMPIWVNMFWKESYAQAEAVKQDLAELSSRQVMRLCAAANYLDIRLRDSNDYPASKSFLDVVCDELQDRIFFADLMRIGTMTDVEYATYQHEVLEPLNHFPKELRERLISRGLRSGIYRLSNAIAADKLDFRLAQIAAYVERNDKTYAIRSHPSDFKLPVVLENALSQVSSWFEWTKGKVWKNETLIFGSKQWPARCPLPGLPNYNPQSLERKPDERYRDNGDGTIADLCTLLTWEEIPSPVRRFSPETAAEHCKNLAKGGFHDWRLPTPVELFSLWDGKSAGVAYRNRIFKGDVQRNFVTSSKREKYKILFDWGLNFGERPFLEEPGPTMIAMQRDTPIYSALCVR